MEMIEIRLDAVADAIIVVGRDEARKLKHNCLYSIQWFANYLITAIERESRVSIDYVTALLLLL